MLDLTVYGLQGGMNLRKSKKAAVLYYIGFRPARSYTGTTPSSTPPFTLVSEGKQSIAFSTTDYNTAYLISFSKYSSGTTTVISGGTSGSMIKSITGDTASATVTLESNGYQLTVTPKSSGKIVVVITTASGDAQGELTINIT